LGEIREWGGVSGSGSVVRRQWSVADTVKRLGQVPTYSAQPYAYKRRLCFVIVGSVFGKSEPCLERGALFRKGNAV
jgi:hypothetical protein